MSGNAPRLPTAKPDRRVVRTREMLGDALVELMHERPFNDITVQDVLDRAGVGRSTFYAHYSDKDDLFLSDLEEFLIMFASALTRHSAGVERLAPVAELFSHVRDMREFVAALKASGKWNEVQTLARGIFARSIQERLRNAGAAGAPLEMAARAHALAGSIVALLDWWIDQDMKTEPEEMDAIFHRMAWSGVKPAR